ncbi:helix-turn-helix transcriptional regulator [Saccharomonospora iraqiensis]|uniref:helix-turn-helix transcriptional regulator n=1 Tax=Saccharomonospora iraqiensis TaxID=52698 RepID=UPI00022E246A|nr:LuxR C-terminal-related transcriptional regulator [Saccharomonospora iraqiensis]
MPAPHRQSMRPDDGDAFRHCVRLARRETGLPLVFGGRVGADGLRLTEFAGARTDAIRGLRVQRGRGLGGVVLERGRPHAVTDYVPATTITHDYDDPVQGEGIRSIVATPVAVHGGVRGVLYAAVRDVHPLGDRATAALGEVSRRLAGELAVRDEVDRRIALLDAAHRPRREEAPPPVTLDELRDLHAELRGIAHDVDDAAIRERLRRACECFTRVEHDAHAEGAGRAAPVPRLSSREVDVLSYVALGCTSAEAAHRLGLSSETVKAYLRSACRKLGVHTRHDAVATARRHGLLI